jgi:hypothetical protein
LKTLPEADAIGEENAGTMASEGLRQGELTDGGMDAGELVRVEAERSQFRVPLLRLVVP